MESSAIVSVVKSENVQEQVRKALDLLGGIGQFVDVNHSVLIKPSLVTNKNYVTGVTTNPAVVEAVVIELQKIGVRKILIGDGCAAIHIGTVKIMDNHGIGDVARKYNCTLVDLNVDRKKVVHIPRPQVLEQCEVACTVLEVDRIINIGQMKTHFITGVSLSLKSMKGCVSPAQKRMMHDLGVDKALMDMSQIIRADLSIIDGTVGHEGMGPAEGNPVGMQTIVAGKDPLAVDTVACYLMGFDPESIPHIRLAGELGLGENRFSHITVLGSPLADVRRSFKPAQASLEGLTENLIVYNGSPCSGCIGSVSISAQRMLEGGVLKEVEAQGKRISFILGPKPIDVDGDDDEVFFIIGNCAKRYSDRGIFVPGCAPAAIDLINSVADKFGIKFNPI